MSPNFVTFFDEISNQSVFYFSSDLFFRRNNLLITRSNCDRLKKMLDIIQRYVH